MSADPRTYRLYLPRSVKILIFAMPIFLMVAGALLFSGVLPLRGSPQPLEVIGAIWVAMIGWLWYWILSIPYRIEVSETGEIEFRSLIRRRRMTPLEIVSVRPEASSFGFLVVRGGRRKIRLLNQFDGFHDFLVSLKAANPTIELRGC
jgi:hypothetical protein